MPGIWYPEKRTKDIIMIGSQQTTSVATIKNIITNMVFSFCSDFSFEPLSTFLRWILLKINTYPTQMKIIMSKLKFKSAVENVEANKDSE